MKVNAWFSRKIGPKYISKSVMNIEIDDKLCNDRFGFKISEEIRKHKPEGYNWRLEGYAIVPEEKE